MAKKFDNTSGGSENLFNGGMSQDVKHFGMKKGDYINARNAVNKSIRGDVLSRSMEPANKLCASAPFAIIGAENLEAQRWIIFSTNNSMSEIGEFDASTCTYAKIARDACMGFKTSNLIVSVSRPSFNGGFDVYFDDGSLNVSRKFNTKSFPFIQNCVTVNNCVTCTDTENVDCSKLRLESFVQAPCLELKKGPSLGVVPNGSYSAFVAYLVNGVKVTDYIGRSNVLSVFDHSNVNSSLDLHLENLDTSFDQYELVVVSVVAQKTVARKIGEYSTRQKDVTLDGIDNTLPVVSLDELRISNPVPDRSDAMFKLGKYLVRTNPSNKFDFNYQPLANQIRTLWQSVEYPVDYYKKGGTNVGNMRDEVMCYFIEFLYNTGDVSRAYTIPGRAPIPYTITTDAGASGVTVMENALCPSTVNDIESPAYQPKVFEVYNTAYLTATPNTVLPDGGIVVAEGLMGYHESTELYDDKKPEVWNAGVPGHPEWDLCGQPIRHHRFPDNILQIAGGVNKLTNHYADGGNAIRVMGVRFENIQPPVDNYGNLIPGIVGYRILRGSRQGQKTVLFKGMINNMFEYNIPKEITNRTGLYANYPFNDLNPDPFISKNINPVTYEPGLGGLQNYEPNDRVSLKNFTFHSPDTTFEHPFLNGDELKIYGAMWGESRGNYLEPDKHPRHKFVTDLSFVGAIVVGFGYSISKMNGTRKVTYPGYIMDSDPVFAGTSTSVGNVGGGAALVGLGLSAGTANNTISLMGVVDALTGNNSGLASVVSNTKSGVVAAGLTAAAIPSTGVTQQSVTFEFENQEQSPSLLKFALAALGNPMFLGYMSDGANTFMELIKSVGAWRQYAIKYEAYCGYENSMEPYANNRRKAINNARYLNGDIQNFENNYRINHKYRFETVALSTKTDVRSITGAIEDVSRPPLITTIGSDKFGSKLRRASSHYVAVKSRKRNQYGQLDQVVMVPATPCPIDISMVNSPVVFGGDTYIGRYSEKNTMYYFDKWLKDEPDGAVFNYYRYKMLEHIAFWMDTDPFDLMEFVNSVPSALGAAISSGSVSTFFSSLVTPSDKHCFDRGGFGTTGLFLLKNVYMYLFQSGVRDFFVESEINIDHRDWEDSDDKKHWPVLSDLRTMFQMDLIKADNYYKYDKSLSVDYLAQNRIRWNTIQDRDYSPFLSETVYTKHNRRLIYSLPQETSNKKDNFSVFLPLNYKDFTSDITGVKPIGKTAGLIFFATEAPKMLPGVDEIKTTNGTKLTIGDGSLFSRELQSLDNSEMGYQYGSCQNRLSIVNTPVGIMFMSQDSGNIFLTDGSALKKIGDEKLQRFLNTYLPYQLIKDFPDYDRLDNPVSGIGCQAVYLPDNDVVYFCKKDYALRTDLPDGTTVNYLGNNEFKVDGYLNVRLGDPRFFESASWTFSWDPTENSFISFHDWHPSLILTGPNVFHTTNLNKIWKHNARTDLFCNFYGKQHPFEITFNADSKFEVNTLRNIEYYLEAYVYGENNYDRFLKLNDNFDEAIIYNSEQCSGVLRLNYDNGLNPKYSRQFPITHNGYIDILFSKEEQKYRFNQFWDIVRDRGEFSNLESLIWNTKPNGYVKVLNPTSLNYNKNVNEQKKFRHHNVEILLRKNLPSNAEFVISLALLKTLKSSR